MNSKFHIAKRKYVYDIFASIFRTIFLIFFALAVLSPEGEEFTIEFSITEFYLLIAAFVVAFVAQLIIYWLILRKHVFYDQEKSFVVEKGLFLKRKANIPYKNIHTISLKRRFFDLILGLSIIEIDTGTTASFKSEGRLVLDKDYAIVLKNYFETKKVDDSKVLPSPKDFVVGTSIKSDQNHLRWYQLLALAVMKQPFLQAMLIMVILILAAGSFVIQISEDASLDQNLIHLVYLCLSGIVVSTMTTMLYHLFKYFKYRYQIDQENVTYSYGLFKKVELKTPIRRINAVHLNQPLLFRIFGYYQLNLSVLGVGELSDGEQFKVESKAILPIAKLHQVKEVLEQIGFMTNAFDQEVAPNQFKHLNFVIFPMFFCIVLNFLPYFIFTIENFDFTIIIIIQVFVVLLVLIGSILSLKQHKIAFSSHEILFQRGSFTLMQTIIKKQRIQIISYKQGPILLIENIGNIAISYKDILGLIVMKSFNNDSFNIIKQSFLD
jgi:putative membrane protein